MAAITSQGGLVNSTALTLSSTTLATATAFAVTFPTANQFGIFDGCHYFALPANHGGLAMNYLVPTRLDGGGTNPWALARPRQDWIVEDMDGSELWRVQSASINDPFHIDSAVIIAPGPDARNLRVRSSAMFRQGAGTGGVVNYQAALAGAGANVTVMAFSHVEFRLY